MRKSVLLFMAAVMLFSGCASSTGSGAYVGASFGSILGSAIGGLSDGPRGSDLGTIIGMAGGAVVGAAIGSIGERGNDVAYDEQARRDERMEEVRRHRRQTARTPYGNRDAQTVYNDRSAQQNDDTYYHSGAARTGNNGNAMQPVQGTDESGFNGENSGDDRIYDFTSSDYTGSYSAQKPTTVMPGEVKADDMLAYTPHLEIRDARFVDDNKDNVINRGEVCKVIFEVVNKGTEPISDVQPTVWETTGNKHIFVSPGIHVERIAPGKGIRYTAIVQADKRLRNGEASIHVAVLQGEKAISKVAVFNIPTKK